jgi:transposase
MWTKENRRRYTRDKLRYPSDLTDEEWSEVRALIPPAKRGRQRREVDVREILNGLMYILSTGCQWRYIPKDLPPKSMLNGYFQRWDYDGTLGKIHYALYQKCREQEDRQASPTARVIDRPIKDMPLAAFNHFLSSIAARAAHFRPSDRLAVDHSGGRAGVPAGLLTHIHQQQVIDNLPGAVVPPSVEIALDRRVGPQFLGQHPPLTADLGDVE